ncbi:Ca-activated chloride channel family protein [Rhizobium sp. NFR07]|uniref:vWA domain-containing protein n=1 Tax=Rhizobium sp. NFR07 TaxID=1566262 RepID=UPI0008EE5AB8|nr:VWA domain-containing protein [Rhizobium sp. NFR07]SFB32537.1 Ca-activated chloride channel family protein [Rhizobium sp. NFR07]
MIVDFHFLRPWWLMALLLPPIVLWLASNAGDHRNRWRGMIAPHLLDHLIIAPDRRRHMRPAWIIAMVIVLVILAGAGPTWQREAPPFVSDAASLVIAVDLSPSMDAIDISPSRLEHAKLKIDDILAARRGARSAIIAYAGTAHLVVPLTEDDELIKTYSDALATRIMPKPGKDTAAALSFANNLLKADGGPGTILLMTDGIENTAAGHALQIDSDVVVLGIGTAEGGLVKQADGGFLTGAGGSRIVAKLDLDALKGFANTNGFPVATLTSDDADIRWIIRHVSTNVTQQIAREGDRWHDAGWWLLFPIALLLVFSFRRGWVVQVAMLCFCLRFVLPTPTAAAEMADMWLTPDQQGRRAFERGDFESAAAHFHDPMWKGVSLYRAGRFQDAIDSFAVMDTAESWFDQANSLFHLGKLEEAATAYQTALERRPAWPEAVADLAVAQRLLQQQKDEESEQQQDPNQKPDSIQFDDKGKRGKAGTVAAAEQTSEMWMKNIEVSPTDLMARKFAIELREGSP